MKSYKASYNPPKGKKGYTTNFRHPIIMDKSGKYGLKVHRGLGTQEENEAKELVDSLNELMTNDYWWDLSKRTEAYSRYSPIIVDAFYDPMERNNLEETELLNKIKVPGKDDGYTRTCIIGPSGAGKTSLLRLLCGTIKEKYPTTSTGRTTSCNMEVIMSDDGTYEVVITFMSRGLFEMYVQECIENAITYGLIEEIFDREKLSEKLLIHKDLIIRLSYILGDLSLCEDRYNEYEGYDEYDEISEVEKYPYEYKQDIPTLVSRIDVFVDSLIDIIMDLKGKEVLPDDENVSLEENDDVLSLRDDIVNEVQKRFSYLKCGDKLNTTGKWVNAWYFSTENREEFIKVVKMFSSNSKGLWGGLLSPIVSTMRVKGDFRSTVKSDFNKIVYYDGLGLGHKTAMSSMPLELIDRFKESDSIIIVDNAQAPVLDTVKMALKSVIESGAASKLLMCFTHIDLMMGSNFYNFNDKRKHVLSALSSYLMEIRKQNPLLLSDVEEKEILNSCHYFSSLDKNNLSVITEKETIKLFENFKKNFTKRITVDDVIIRYDAMTLYAHMQIAIKKYRTVWGYKIGYTAKTDLTEHWSRVKALTKRLAYFNLPHYNNELMPLSDLAQEIREQINLFLNNPMSIIPAEIDSDVKVELINLIKADVSVKISEFIKDEMWQNKEQLNRWEEAYVLRGRYSTFHRSAKINEIFELAAPQIDNFAYNMTDIQKQYIMRVMHIMETAIQNNNGVLEKFNY